MPSPCAFCEIAAGRAPASTVHREEGVLAFMANAPVNAGHLLVIPEVHAPLLADLDPELGARLFVAARRLGSALRRSALRCEAINLFLADGEAASQLVPHVHLHVIPRFTGDAFKLNPKGGVTTWQNAPSRDELDAAAEAVRGALAAP
jgi:histidine triad (HIT) family protein